ncbi:RNA polymerase sigma factor [Paenibacillus sp. MMS20-IR301]|nr:RNA polymerase sigma factor [Paenibacillus sp. MMS20-IR301]WNS42406.1 RNA polymerase sigma factor [Paenibacillus sp. MMS20-IR301]
MKEADLQERITQVLAGDIQKFEAIMQVYQKQIFFYCYHMLGHYAEAEDCGQEVFLKAYRSLGSYNRDTPFGAWLYTIAYNQCIDVIRKRRLARYLRLFHQDEKQHRPVDQHIEAHYPDAAVQQAMARLTADERSLLLLRTVDELSYAEISLMLQQNTARLRKRYERASGKFKKYYIQATGGTRNGQEYGHESGVKGASS